jgi:hypothetical protein
MVKSAPANDSHSQQAEKKNQALRLARSLHIFVSSGF